MRTRVGLLTSKTSTPLMMGEDAGSRYRPQRRRKCTLLRLPTACRHFWTADVVFFLLTIQRKENRQWCCLQPTMADVVGSQIEYYPIYELPPSVRCSPILSL